MSEDFISTQLLVAGQWQDAADGRTLPVFNPATGEEIGKIAHASNADLARVAEGAAQGFAAWRALTAWDRFVIMRKAANLLRER
ncbi:hypothetical protein AD951_00820, partial [Acetobacter malorum]